MKESVEDIFDRCLDDVEGGRHPEDVLAGYRQHPEYEHLEKMLYLALDLRKLQGPPASEIPDFTAMLSLPGVDPAKSKLLTFQLITRIAAVFVLAFLLLAGTAQASSGTIPGDLLYPVKRNFEKVRFAFIFNGKDEAEFKIGCSSLRLSEAMELNEKRGKADIRLFASMFDDSRYALEKSATLPATDRDEIIFRTAYLIKKQKEGMNQIYKTTQATNKTELAQYRCACGKRDELMKSMLGVKITLPSESSCSDMDICCGCSEGAECRVSSEEMTKMKKSIQPLKLK